ncbi:5-carboxymethyl-2-hydroxymuconate Delta-isomerase [Paraburkholderia caledonica]|uniref:5-carboxymethyl-2-hydroxymuconate Delta-isomerase n=1 Tax=Paraburkholderia caledonica TaxID=134536 RepID=UPI000B3FEFD7|nr:5-carboxymethyl-2-hydroxymuconate Delta-isomerase [Paraburkholderia caledonica]
MPQVRLECSSNLDSQFNPEQTLLRLNEALIDSGLFNEVDIKSRIIRCERFLIGRSTEDHAFVHLQIIILSGRDTATKAGLSARMLTALRDCFEPLAGVQTQLGVQVLDNERETYSKEFV